MAKTKKDRPSLNGFQLLDLIKNKKIKVYFLDDKCPVMILLQGATVTQYWLEKNKKEIVKRRARTYLRKGILLMPIWHEVSSWKISHYKENGLALSKLGIFCFEGKYFVLNYMQIDGLDKAFRQPLHVLDKYLEKVRRYPKDMPRDCNELLKIGRINSVIKDRLSRIRWFSKKFMNNLKKNRQRLEKILSYFEKKAEFSQNDIRTLEEMIIYCRAIKSRPMYRKLYFAARSLELAIKYIRENNYPRAQARMRSALKNMTYPNPTS